MLSCLNKPDNKTTFQHLKLFEMASYRLILTVLKFTTAVWALLVVDVDAALVAQCSSNGPSAPWHFS
jgi:hypothetical protein